jgi:hypothetical protein
VTHDPLCYRSHDKPLGRDPFCHCDLIAQVRKDERTRHDGQSVILASASAAAIDEVLAQYVNNDCGWGWGECVIGCPSCKRFDELVAERSAGYEEGKAEAIAGAVKRLEEYLQHDVADGWMPRGKMDGILDIVRHVSQ